MKNGTEVVGNTICPKFSTSVPFLKMKARGFLFTIFNYTDATLLSLQDMLGTRCGIAGKEICPSTQTPHLQCYIYWRSPHTLKSTIKHLQKITGLKPSVRVANGSPDDNRRYCSKDGDFIEWGEWPKQGRRTDIEKFIKKASAVRSTDDEKALMDEMPREWGRYYKAGREAAKLTRAVEARSALKKKFADATLRDWQQSLVERLDKQPERQLTWAYEHNGNIGKSWLATWLAINRDAFVIDGGKVADIAYAYNCQPWVVFDLTRSAREHSSYLYSVIECFLNGRIFSPKYDSGTKEFPPCTVVVFANWAPDLDLLSSDRWDVIDLAPPTLHGSLLARCSIG